MKNLKGSIILFLGALIWGTTFVAQTTGARHIETFTFNAARSYVGALFLLVLIFVLDGIKNKKKQIAGALEPNNLAESKGDTQAAGTVLGWPVIPGIICGAVLCVAMGAQQYGISIYPEGAAASGRAGFLTAVYVVLVALAEQFLMKKKQHFLVLVAVVGCIAGMYLLCVSEGFQSIYLGDIFELLCALCFTVHILVVDRFKHVDSVKLSCMQLFSCAIFSTVVALLLETIRFADLKAGLFSILYAGVLSSGVAYTFQMIGQKYAQPAVASIVMSLESVIAAIAGALILSEVLSGRELLGCSFVFGSVILAQIPQFLRQTDDK